MSGFKILFLTVVMTASLIFPALVSAQSAPAKPHVFLGSVTGTNGPAQDGTVVNALIDDQQVGTAIVANGDYPALLVEQPLGSSYVGKEVTFTIGGLAAAESKIWVEGEASILNLTVAPVVVANPTATPQPESTPGSFVLRGDKGDPGEQGETGAKGDDGDPGPSGPSGQQGPSGPAGPPGQSGQAGPSGPAGPAGPSGSSGPAGVQGSQGPIGPAGSSSSSTIASLALVFGGLALVMAGGRIAWNWLQQD